MEYIEGRVFKDPMLPEMKFEDRFAIYRTSFHRMMTKLLDYTRRARVTPKGTFCVRNTLNIYHTYHDVTIQNPSIIDLA